MMYNNRVKRSSIFTQNNEEMSKSITSINFNQKGGIPLLKRPSTQGKTNSSYSGTSRRGNESRPISRQSNVIRKKTVNESEFMALRSRLLQDPSLEGIEMDELSDLYSFLREHSMSCARNEQYDDAEASKLLSELVKEGIKKKEKENMENKDFAANNKRTAMFEEKCAEKLRLFDDETEKKRVSLVDHHSREMGDFEDLWANTMPNKYRKPSQRLLQLKQIEKSLAKSGEYNRAKVIHEQTLVIASEEQEFAQQNLVKDYQLALTKLKEKQQSEIDQFVSVRRHWRSVLEAQQKSEKEAFLNRENVVREKARDSIKVTAKANPMFSPALVTSSPNSSSEKSKGSELLLPPLRPPNDPAFIMEENKKKRQTAKKKLAFQKLNAEISLSKYSLGNKNGEIDTKSNAVYVSKDNTEEISLDKSKDVKSTDNPSSNVITNPPDDDIQKSINELQYKAKGANEPEENSNNNHYEPKESELTEEAKEHIITIENNSNDIPKNDTSSHEPAAFNVTQDKSEVLDTSNDISDYLMNNSQIEQNAPDKVISKDCNYSEIVNKEQKVVEHSIEAVDIIETSSIALSDNIESDVQLKHETKKTDLNDRVDQQLSDSTIPNSIDDENQNLTFNKEQKEKIFENDNVNANINCQPLASEVISDQIIKTNIETADNSQSGSQIVPSNIPDPIPIENNTSFIADEKKTDIVVQPNTQDIETRVSNEANSPEPKVEVAEESVPAIQLKPVQLPDPEIKVETDVIVTESESQLNMEPSSNDNAAQLTANSPKTIDNQPNSSPLPIPQSSDQQDKTIPNVLDNNKETLNVMQSSIADSLLND